MPFRVRKSVILALAPFAQLVGHRVLHRLLKLMREVIALLAEVPHELQQAERAHPCAGLIARLRFRLPGEHDGDDEHNEGDDESEPGL